MKPANWKTLPGPEDYHPGCAAQWHHPADAQQL